MYMAAFSSFVWGGLLLVLLMCWLRGLWEPRHPENTQPTLGEGSEHIRVLLLTDLHAGLCRVPIRLLEDRIRGSQIDVILHGGDACSGQHDAAEAIQLLSRLSRVSRDLSIPFYTIRGNHDGPISTTAFAEAGVTLLVNDVVCLESAAGTRWALCGLDDLRTGFPAMPPDSAFPTGVPAERTIVLAHNPDTLFLLSPKRVRFILSGHFHGGQIWAPFNLEFKLMRREQMADDGYRSGAFARDGFLGYISRGIGCVVFPLRFRSRPEIPLITIRTTQAEETQP